jgi:hypothetical protein
VNIGRSRNDQQYALIVPDDGRLTAETCRTQYIQSSYKLLEDFVTFVSITHSERNIWSRTMFTSHHFQRHYQNCESTSTAQSGTSHNTCLRGFGGNGSIAWTSAVPHVGRTSNVFKVTMKLQTFLFQMVVTLCVAVRYLWKYGFAKYYHNLYAPCRIKQWYIQCILLVISTRYLTCCHSPKCKGRLTFSVYRPYGYLFYYTRTRPPTPTPPKSYLRQSFMIQRGTDWLLI